jgi:hypothetical protein
MGTPAEQVGQTEHAQRAGHVDDGQQVLLEGGAVFVCWALGDFLWHVTLMSHYQTELTS